MVTTRHNGFIVLNYIMNCYCGGMKFSESVMEAVKRGYTEPNPLTDLRGEDLSRKILILAREAGVPLDRSFIEDIKTDLQDILKILSYS